MTFKYPPLGPNELRLLRPINPVPITHCSDLNFAVVHAPRSGSMSYTAVSYTWGDADATETIFLDGRRFRVRPNLWSCLYYLGLNTKHSPVKHIWADAICINQTDDLERNAQVRVMDEIYRNAAYVSIWLGLVSFPDHFESMYTIEGPIKTLEHDDFTWGEYIDELAKRPYWSRYWVIQECMLAQHLQVHCSDHIAHWEDFREALDLKTDVRLYNVGTGLGDSRTVALVDSVKYGALPLLLARQGDHDPMMGRPLHTLLIHHRQSQCKDPRDRVFALLGLLPFDERKLLQRFFPDYSLSEDHVITIALAHVQLVNNEHITAEDERLFEGLGVDSKFKRERLLKEAGRFPYLDVDDASAAAFHAASMSVSDETNFQFESIINAASGLGAIDDVLRDPWESSAPSCCCNIL